MDLYYFCSNVREKLKKHGCQDYIVKVERSNPLIFKVITTKSNRIFTDFADGKKRIIARDVTSYIAPTPVKFKRIIMFIDLVLWGSKEWEILNHHNGVNTDKLFERMKRVSEPELLEVKRLYQEKITEKQEQLPDLPGDYLPWLSHPHWKDSGGDYGLTICESSLWIEEVIKFENSFSSLLKLMEIIYNDVETKKCRCPLPVSSNLCYVAKERYGIFYSYFSEGASRTIFLVTPFKYSQDDEIEKLATDLMSTSMAHIFSSNQISNDDILRFSLSPTSASHPNF